LRLRDRWISTAVGGEHGSVKRPLTQAMLATDRGTDPHIRSHDRHSRKANEASRYISLQLRVWDNLANCPTATGQSRRFVRTRNCKPI